MEGLFYKERSEYKNTLDPLRDCYVQYREYIKNTMGISLEDAGRIAAGLIKTSFRDRQIKFFERMSNGDRRVSSTGVYSYIKANVNAGNIIAPTFTTYLNSEKKQSIQSEYIFENVTARSISKKEGQDARARGDMILATFKNGEQNNKKIQNNEVSGLYATRSSVICNPTAHSTLTSITRTITSMTNASNERLVEGNRNLFTGMDVFRSIVNESTYSNQEDVNKACQRFDLHYPSVREVVDILQYSSDLYFKDQAYYDKYIIPYLHKITPAQRATIAYTTDIYHFKKHNPEFMRDFLVQLTKKVTGYDEPLDEEGIKKLKSVNQAVLFFVHNIFVDDIRSMGVNYERMNKAGIAHNLYMTCLNVMEVLENYKEFFIAFFRTDIAPINSNKMRFVRRRAVVLSDTDSSAFSTDEIIKWMFGKFVVNAESIALTGAMTYMSAENIVHQLAKISKSMNIEEKNLNKLALKNEWLWLTHIPTTLSKHYMADAAIQEGNVFDKTDLEIKGVHLRSSNVPPEIIARGDAIAIEILRCIRENVPLDLDPILREAIKIEEDVIESIGRSEIKFLKTLNINDEDAYTKDADLSPYRNHTFYVEVFQDKLGDFGEPPYTVVKIPTILNNKTAIKDWIASVEDPDIKNNLEVWNEKNNRASLNNIFMNHTLVLSSGIPKEIIPIIDHEAVIKDMTTQIRMILGTLGIVLVENVPIRDQIVLPEILGE